MGGLDDKAHDLLPMFLGLNTENPGLCVRDFWLLQIILCLLRTSA